MISLREFIEDLRVGISEEFDRNFERKGFFDEKWPETRIPNPRGSLMMRSGSLRRSIRSESTSNTIKFFSSLPYAAIHNDGGTITVTENMKKYFWAMHRKAGGAAKSNRMTKEAAFFKAMALKKVGSKIIIQKRQFIGHHVQIDQAVDQIFQRHLKNFENTIVKKLKP